MMEDRWSIAWFRLAEFVQRKEKERALAVYRLLVHSWHDEAYSLQLGADLVRAFQDFERAAEWYQEAARAYEDTQRPFAAAHAYELLLSCPECPRRLFFYRKMMSLFDRHRHERKIQEHAMLFVEAVLDEHDVVRAWEMFREDSSYSPETQGVLLHHFVLVLAMRETPNAADYALHEQIVRAYCDDFSAHGPLLNSLTDKLAGINGPLHAFAQTCLGETRAL